MEATADGTLATRIEAKLSARVAKERATFVEVRRALAAQIAEASATTAKLTDEVVRLEGRARELVEAKLRAEVPGSTTPNAGAARSRTTPSTSSWWRASGSGSPLRSAASGRSGAR
ncbi:MAG: hypothetical protein ACOZQL_34275 [Myxococcota bacterium]